MPKFLSRIYCSILLAVVLSLPAPGTAIAYDQAKNELRSLRDLKPEERTETLRRHAADATELILENFPLPNEDWEIITAMPNLESLSLSATGITESQIEGLAKCPKLRKLYLSNEKLAYSRLSAIKPLPDITEVNLDCESAMNTDHEYPLQAFPNLTSLSLRAMPIGGIINLNCLSPLKHKLKHLYLSCGPMQNQQVLGQLDHLTLLNLWFPQLDAAGNQSLGQLQTLEELTLCANGLTKDSYKNMTKLTNLKKLGVNNNNVTGEDVRLISQMSSLQSLHMDYGTYKDSDIASLSRLEKLTELDLDQGPPLDGSAFEDFKGHTPLVDLQFNGEKLDEKGARAVSALTTLRKLRISYCTTDSAWAKYFGQLTELDTFAVPSPRDGADLWAQAIGKMHNLSFVSLGPSDLSDSGVASILADTKCETLDLQYTAISDRSIPMLQALKNLKTLYLSGCNITDRGLERIGALKNLVSLYLERTRITDAGLKYLKPLTRLQVLSLDYNDILGSGLQVIAVLPALTDLRLRGSTLTDKGMLALAGAKVDTLDISGTNVTEHSLPVLTQLTGLKHLNLDGCGFMTKEPIPGKNTGYVITVPTPLLSDITGTDIPTYPVDKLELQEQLPALSAKLLKEPDNDYLYERRAMILATLGRHLEALPDFEKAIYGLLHPKYYGCSNLARGRAIALFDMLKQRAFCYNVLKQYDLALKDADFAVSLNRLSVSARKLRAYAYLQTGSLDLALQDLNRALEIDPGSAASYAYRSSVYEKLRKPALATVDRLKATDLGYHPEYPDEHWLLFDNKSIDLLPLQSLLVARVVLSGAPLQQKLVFSHRSDATQFLSVNLLPEQHPPLVPLRLTECCYDDGIDRKSVGIWTLEVQQVQKDGHVLTQLRFVPKKIEIVIH